MKFNLPTDLVVLLDCNVIEEEEELEAGYVLPTSAFRLTLSDGSIVVVAFEKMGKDLRIPSA